jgi:hypothetical protein
LCKLLTNLAKKEKIIGQGWMPNITCPSWTVSLPSISTSMVNAINCCMVVPSLVMYYIQHHTGLCPVSNYYEVCCRDNMVLSMVWK